MSRYNLRKRNKGNNNSDDNDNPNSSDSFDIADVYGMDDPNRRSSKKKRISKSPDQSVGEFSDDDDQDINQEDIEDEPSDNQDSKDQEEDNQDDIEDDDDDQEYDPSDNNQDDNVDLLSKIMNKADPENPEAKEEKIKRWMEKVPIHKKRTILPLAKIVYDRVHAIPLVSDILLSNMPLGEKCALIEKIEILEILEIGTEAYFDMKKDIFRRIANYRAITVPDPRLEALYSKLNDLPTINDVLQSKAPSTEKLSLIQKIEELHQDTPGTESFYANKQMIEQKLESYRNMAEDPSHIESMDRKVVTSVNTRTDPLRMRILKADVSERNRSVILDKLKRLDMLPATDSTYAKLHEWIERALLLSDTVIPLEIPDSKEQYLLSVKQFMDDRLFGMNTAKERLIELLAMRVSNPNSKDMSLAIYGPPGVGKCVHPNTQILMYLGGMKAAKDILRGDILMGDDSQPRIVLSTTTGRDCMYKITPEYSEPFIVNEPHVITLYNEFTEHASDIPLNEYLKKSETWKAKHKMFCVPVEYAKTPTKNDPYLVGILLNSKSNTVDDIVKEYLTNRLDNLASYVSGMSDIRSLNVSTIDREEIAYLLNHRYIPDCYLYNSRENRYKLLKGFIEVTRERKPVEQQRSRSLERTPNSAGGKSSISGKSKTPTKRANTPKPTRTSILRNSLKQPMSGGPLSGRRLSTTPDTSPRSTKSRTPGSSKSNMSSKSNGASCSRSHTPASAKSSRAASREKPVGKAGLAKFVTKAIPKVIVRTAVSKTSSSSKTSSTNSKTSTSKPANERISNKKQLSIETRGRSPGRISEPSDSDGSPISRGRVERQTRLKQFRERLTVINGKDTKLTVKDKLLGEQIKFLARSLGFKTMYISDEIWICDDIDILPPITRKIETNFHVTQLVTSEYCGFTLDGNGRFVLSSFLVTHNTHLAKVYADAIKQPFAKINMGGSSDSHYFLGHSYTYEGATPGAIVKALSDMKDSKSNKCRSGIIFLDEFDKIGIGTRVAHTFLHISDPIQQSDFQDQYMPEIKVDLSNITFIYSMNDPKDVDPTLLNRLPVIELPGYSKKEKASILGKFVLADTLKNVGLAPDSVSFTEDAMNRIVEATDKEDHKGIRKGKHVINDIVAKINALVYAPNGLFSYKIKDFKLPVKITSKTLDDLKVLQETDKFPIEFSLYT